MDRNNNRRLFHSSRPICRIFSLGDNHVHVIFFLIGGFIAGIFSQGNVMDGIYSGLKCGFLGGVFMEVLIVAAVISSLLRGPLDFIAGMAIFLGLIFVALAALFASAGAVIGVMVRKMAL